MHIRNWSNLNFRYTVSEEMPPRKEFRIPKSDVAYSNSNSNDSTVQQEQRNGRPDKSLDEKKVEPYYTVIRRIYRNEF